MVTLNCNHGPCGYWQVVVTVFVEEANRYHGVLLFIVIVIHVIRILQCIAETLCPDCIVILGHVSHIVTFVLFTSNLWLEHMDSYSILQPPWIITSEQTITLNDVTSEKYLVVFYEDLP